MAPGGGLAIVDVGGYLQAMTTRRERFRQTLMRLDPIATTTVESGWIRPPPDSFLERMQAALELDLPRRYLLMGGVGSGKTTELLRLKQELERDPKRLVIYLDVSEHAEPTSLKAGAILAMIGIALCDLRPSELLNSGLRPEDREWFHNYAFGIERYPGDDFDDAPEPPEPWIEGGVARLPRRGAARFGVIASVLERSLGGCSKTHSAALILLDGLDRLSDLDVLEALIRYDIPVLKQMKPMEVSTLLVAPLSVYLGSRQPLRGGFDQEFLHLYRDPAETRSNSWLNDVLTARVEEEMLPAPVRQLIVSSSGGVVRDMLMIARASVEEAFVSATDRVDEAQVKRVVAAHGRKLLLGTGKEQLATLLELHRTGKFELITDEDVDLVLHRRVLFYDDNRYAVHPAIAPLLDRLPGVANGK